MTSEKQLESAVLKYCKANNVLCFKFVSPSNRGVPDRILVGPHGDVAFLELKAPGKKPTPLQLHVIKTLQARDAKADWVDNLDAAKDFIAEWLRRGVYLHDQL